MRPTNGDTSVAPASAASIACGIPNISVMLQWMPSRSSASTARMPSHVDATLISTRWRSMPCWSYSAMIWCAFAIVPAVSNDSRASTSVETRPGTIFRISAPNAISSGSMTSPDGSARWSATTFSTSDRYASLPTAFRISDGFVVASCGRKSFIVSKSPVSATTVVYCLSCSSWFMFRSGWSAAPAWRPRCFDTV